MWRAVGVLAHRCGDALARTLVADKPIGAVEVRATDRVTLVAVEEVSRRTGWRSDAATVGGSKTLGTGAVLSASETFATDAADLEPTLERTAQCVTLKALFRDRDTVAVALDMVLGAVHRL
ncbi:MAG: hypothetical protein VYA56_02770, partial [Actinomycetota bacterium]|nr:hypothetical protein [Actinomycetota bacterium]